MRGPLIGGDVEGDLGVGYLEVGSIQSGETILDYLFFPRFLCLVQLGEWLS